MEQKAKILIVEDNAIVAADIKSRVQQLGYKVTGCISRGENVLSEVELELPSLILMDIKLKGEMTGIEAATAVRSKHDIPVVYLTSYTDKNTLTKAKQTDPYGYIVKPFDDKDLRTSIEISLHRHQVALELKTSEQWFKTTLSSIGDGVIATDMDSRVNFMNPVAENLTGWPLTEARGRKISDIFDIINETSGKPVENPVDKVIETGRVVGLANHTLLVSRDGKKIPINDSGSPIVIDGQESVGVVLVFQDDSESRLADRKLKESEERFRKLFEHAPLPYQALDEQGNFLEINQTWIDILGYQRKEVIGHKFAEFLHPDSQDHFSENFPIFKSIGEVIGVEFQMRHKDGTFLTVQFDGKTSSDQNGHFLQTHCVFRDVTEMKALQIKVKEQEKNLIQNQKLEAVGTLAGGIAHDFNNILSAIFGFTVLAKESLPAGSQIAEDLDEVLTAAHRAKDLVQQILAFSRQSPISPVPIEPELIIKEALKMLRSSIPTTIQIQEYISQDCGTVVADPTQIHQIIMNLCTNAFHAMEDNGGIMTVELKRAKTIPPDLEESKWGYIELLVSDTGKGIDQQIMDKIFDPFFTTKEQGKGTGLGLSMIYGIVKEHGGCVTVESELGKGTVFHIYIPRFEQPLASVAINDTENTRGTERILFVDDEKKITKMAKAMLENAGYTVTVKMDSFEALKTFQNQPDAFDLVITDQTMPGMTGLDLSKRILQKRPEVPIILCTGYSSIVNEEIAKAQGIREYISKPFTKSTIHSVIRKVLDTQKNEI
jgi:PAS domain S-box-containing protein